MRMIQKCLLTQISRNVEAYMDDIVVTSRKGSDLLADLAETFANLRRYDIKLNPSKCTFGVPGGKLLGFLVSEQGIDANPEKVGTTPNETSCACARCPEAYWMLGRVKSIHLSPQ